MSKSQTMRSTFTQLCAAIDERVLEHLRQLDGLQKQRRPNCLLLSQAYLLMQHQEEWTEPELAHAHTCIHCRQVLDSYNTMAELHDINRRLAEEMDKDPLDQDAINRLDQEMEAAMRARGMLEEPTNFSGAVIPKASER